MSQSGFTARLNEDRVKQKTSKGPVKGVVDQSSLIYDTFVSLLGSLSWLLLTRPFL